MIRFDHVTKLYSGNSKPALNGVDVEIKAGEFVFLVGASGSGKSSFLRLVLKEDRPTDGEIHVLGQRLSSISNRKIPYFRRSLGVVFQDFRLLPGRTVYQNVAFTLQVIGKSRGFIQEAVPDVLKMVGLAGKAERLPHELSGGEQQRVAIARAVVNKPAILLADEPTGNLDPATSAGIMQTLELINAGGTTVVMATHDVSIVDQMKRRVIELIGGNIVRDESGGGYTTSIPIVGAQSAGPAPVVTGASAFATALAEEIEPMELPTSPRTVVEQPAASADPLTYPGQVPTVTGVMPRLSDYNAPLPTRRAAAAAAAAAAQATGAQPTVGQSTGAQATGTQPRVGQQTGVQPTVAGQTAAGQTGVHTSPTRSPAELTRESAAETGAVERQVPTQVASAAPESAAPAPAPAPAQPAAARQSPAASPVAPLEPIQPVRRAQPAPSAQAAAQTAAQPTSEPHLAQMRPTMPTAPIQIVPAPRRETPVAPAPVAQQHVDPDPTALDPDQDPLRHLFGRPSSAPAVAEAPQQPQTVAEPEQPADDDPLALAVRLGLRRPGAAPESAGSQEIGPTS